MKTTIKMLALAGLLALTAGGASAATTVNYIQPDKFSDVPFDPTDRENVLQNISDHFSELGRNLPAGQDLHIDVTDIDLAGREIPSARNGRDLRIMNGRADWPRMELRYSVEQNGQVLKSGQAKLQDMDYQDHINPYMGGDPLRYEKRMIDDWFEKTITHIQYRGD